MQGMLEWVTIFMPATFQWA